MNVWIFSYPMAVHPMLPANIWLCESYFRLVVAQSDFLILSFDLYLLTGISLLFLWLYYCRLLCYNPLISQYYYSFFMLNLSERWTLGVPSNWLLLSQHLPINCKLYLQDSSWHGTSYSPMGPETLLREGSGLEIKT